MVHRLRWLLLCGALLLSTASVQAQGYGWPPVAPVGYAGGPMMGGPPGPGFGPPPGPYMYDLTSPPHLLPAPITPGRPPHRQGFMGGVAAYYVSPHFDNNDGLVITQGNPNFPQTNIVERTRQDFDYDYDVAYGAWVGYTTHIGFGVRGRMFHYDENSETLTAVLPPNVMGGAGTFVAIGGEAGAPIAGFATVSPGILRLNGLGMEQVTAEANLELYTVDLEATWDWRYGWLSMLISAGGRFARIEQSVSATITNRAAVNDVNGVALGTATETQQLAFMHDFDGGGPTVSWFGRFDIAESGWAVFGMVRGSLLVGESQRDTFATAALTVPAGAVGSQGQALPPSATVTRADSDVSDRTIPILEVEVGLEAGVDVYDSRIFIRASAVNQTYFNAGNSTSQNGDLSLFGGKLSAGINY